MGRTNRDLKMLAGFDDWGDVNTGMLEATRSWTRKEADSPFEPLAKVWPCRHVLDFGPVILGLDFWPQELGENKFLLF